jgi:hypothetical protein
VPRSKNGWSYTSTPPYAFTAWYLVKAQEQLYLLPFIILLVVWYGCEPCSLTLREEHKLRVFENRVLRIFRPKREEVAEDYIMWSFINGMPHQIFRMIK